MMMSLKRFGLLAVTLVLAFAWGASTGVGLVHAANSKEAGSEQGHLTLEEAIAIAEEHSPKVRMALLELEDARLAYEHQRSMALMRPDPIALLQAETALEIAERNLALVKNEVRLETSESFLSVLRVQNLMDVIQGSLNLAERQLSIAESRFTVGSAARVEIIRAANQVSTVRATLLEMEGGRELALMAFRMGLGLPLDDTAQPKPEVIEPVDLEVNLAEDLAFALNNRLEILRTQSGVELARKQIELSSNDYTPAMLLARAKVGLQQAEEGLRQVKTGIELEIRQLYQSLIDNERKLQVLQQSIEEAQETLEITQEMYAAGVATDVEVLGAQTALNQAQTDYVNTLFDLRTAQVRYGHATARALVQESGNSR